MEAFGLKAFTLFKDKKMAFFFIFSFLLGVSLQITNGYANPYIQSFGGYEEFKGLFFVEHSNFLISLSQMSETLCILLIPFALKKFGIKNVMLISMFAWGGRFGFFGLGDPGNGVWLFILSCIVYGVAFDFFNVSGSLFVDKETDVSMRSSAQGLFMLMTNGLGATFGSLAAKEVINHFVYTNASDPSFMSLDGWRTSWFIFAGYALVVGIAFAILFEYKHEKE
jgi:nucleoside transporter